MISVIMGVFNSRKYLGDAIESVLNQSVQDFEFIIVDDCSTDDSPAIIEQYRDKDARIRVITNDRNLGLTATLNKALTYAKGELIARFDADDICVHNRLEVQQRYLYDHPDIDIVGSYTTVIDEEGQPVGNRAAPVEHDEIKRMIYRLNPMIHPTVLFRKEALFKIGGYDERFRTSQDYDLWFRALAAGLRFHNIPEALLMYRVNDRYISRKSFRYRWNEVFIRLRGYKILKASPVHWGYLLIPLILGIIPPPLFKVLKKLDPRGG